MDKVNILKKRKRLGIKRIKALLLQGSAMQIPLKAKSVQLCCFSPPYWGLRKYEIPPLVFGGDIDCEHEWETKSFWASNSSSGSESSLQSEGTLGTDGNRKINQTNCKLCGAWKGDLGLEPTPELYLDHMMLVMAEVWRTLRDDGVCFVNIGDSYASQPAGNKTPSGFSQTRPSRRKHGVGSETVDLPKKQFGIKPKSLCLIPQKFAIRCQEAGWIIRSEIIWAKPNPMPESCKDRPTRSHEQIWMMTKQGKYYWDQDAVREPYPQSTIARLKYPVLDHNVSLDKRQDGWVTTKNRKERKMIEPNSLGRNIRDVWTIATEPTPDAHFASWPKKLVARMIRVASAVNDIVLDPFCGTGKTIAEAERFNRIGVGLDLSHSYLSDIAVPRKKKAESTPKTLGFMEELGIG